MMDQLDNYIYLYLILLHNQHYIKQKEYLTLYYYKKKLQHILLNGHRGHQESIKSHYHQKI